MSLHPLALLRRGRGLSTQASPGIAPLLVAVIVGAGGLIPCRIAIAQTGASAAAPKFEVASIKPDHSGKDKMGLMMSPGRLSAEGMLTKMLIQFAYNLKSDNQIVGAPSWINSEKFDIEAKEEDSFVRKLRKLPFDKGQEQVRLMVQSLLADRFHLNVTRETKELPVYALVVAKNGPKLTESRLPPIGPIGSSHPEPHGKPGRVGNRGIMMRPGNMAVRGAPIALLADALSRQPDLGGRVVVDETGLKGIYDFTLKWTPSIVRAGMYRGRGLALSRGPGGGAGASGSAQQPVGPPTASQASSISSDSSGPSIFTAVQQQLGLRLKPTKGPVEVLVIDHIEQPSPD